ncbi:MAG TPA: carboxypeptidase regulatory-like domain-containing protein, partial [Acidobacteriota bacterium]|nr:carboxypeptidase regulatory-like domain-containing protein [Acidobacteriota bacterium]
MNLKKQLLVMAALILLVFSAQAFSQTNASISGSVTDESGGALPGASVTVTNNATGVASKVLTNSAGVFNVPGLPGGTYKISAEMTGFQTQVKTDLSLVAPSVLRVNFTMKIAARNELIEVSAKAENLLLESSSSVGVVLPEEKLTELPLVSSNVLDLIKVMGGVNMTDSPTFGADRTTFAGISAANVNLQRDGVTVNDVRWGTGLSSPVYLNPELIGEFKLVIAPVDAEMGRGSGQVQVITRSGANDFHGSAVWNIQNTALDANQWYQNLTNVATNWRNQEEYTLSAGGPIIKNKTFFFASWDQQIVKIREHNINPQILTKCAQKGIFRWFYGYQSSNYQQVAATPATGSRSSPWTVKSVDAQGNPVSPGNVPAYMTGDPLVGTPAPLEAASVFGPLAAGKTVAMLGN